MLFRGTERFGSEEIDQIFDAMGAEINAGTDKEATSLYTRVLDRHLERAFEVMGDMIWRPRFGELEAEREVVLEEIAMYEDDPAGPGLRPARPGDLRLAPARAPGDRHAPRWSRPSRASSSRPSTPRATCPAAIVIAAAGSVDHDALVEMAAPPSAARRAPHRRRRARRRRRSRARRAPPARASSCEKDTEQYHVCVGGARDRARRRAALRAAGARRGARRDLLLAPVPGGARAPRPGLLGLLLLEPVRAHRRGRPVRGHPPGEPRARRWRSSPAELERCVEDPASEEELDALAREPQGPGGARAGVDGRAHEPSRARRC